MSYWTMPGLISTQVAVMEDRRRKITEGVLLHLGLSLQDVVRRCRVRRFVFARQVIFYLLRKHTVMTLRDIGRMVGGVDHTTVIHSIQTIEDVMSVQPEVRRLVVEIELLIVETF
jgi:chromosomal replication initiator protein